MDELWKKKFRSLVPLSQQQKDVACFPQSLGRNILLGQSREGHGGKLGNDNTWWDLVAVKISFPSPGNPTVPSDIHRLRHLEWWFEDRRLGSKVCLAKVQQQFTPSWLVKCSPLWWTCSFSTVRQSVRHCDSSCELTVWRGPEQIIYVICWMRLRVPFKLNFKLYLLLITYFPSKYQNNV